MKSTTCSVLVTGFEPFERDPVNPSWEIARSLDGWRPDAEGVSGLVTSVKLPCVFGAAIDALDAALEKYRPTLVVSLGLAGGRNELTPERVAVNMDDARIKDNAGQQPIDAPVIPGGPAGYFSTLPIKAIVRDLRAGGIPSSVSNTAGSFVCNHIFYALMHLLATRYSSLAARGGFVHVPALPEQSARQPGMPSMALADQVRGIQLLIGTALKVREDVRETAGQLH
jgi:pyroglutamyl-peptidase